MILLALQMLRHDKPKFIAMILAVALAAFLTQNQASVLVSFLGMAGSQIRDIPEANLWVMEPDTECFDQAKPLKDTAVQIVRGIPGVAWAVPLSKFDANARTQFGKLASVTLLGVPEDSRVGEPKLRLGKIADLYLRDSVCIDPGGFALLFPGKEPRLGLRVRVLDEWLTIRGISNASPPFTGLPLLHASLTTVRRLNQQESRVTTFVVARTSSGVEPETVAATISKTTGWKARTGREFEKMSSQFYEGQGVPQLFYLTISIGFLVGICFTGQTFLMFIKENARAFTTLKVLGFTHWQLAGMVAAQAAWVALIGLSTGTAFGVFVLRAASEGVPFLRGLYVPWEIAVGCCGFLLLITFLAAAFAFRSVLGLQPADVFRS